MLRTGEQDPVDDRPGPGLADLPRLAERTAAAGVQVDVSVRGTPEALGPGLELSAYRIVQEALTNVVKHAGTTSARVDIEHAPNAIVLDIVDRGRGGDVRRNGHGLTGMRERAAATALMALRRSRQQRRGQLPQRFRTPAVNIIHARSTKPAANGHAPSRCGLRTRGAFTGTATPATSKLNVLTDRERQVLGLVAEGLTNVEIGERLYIAPGTAKVHVARLLHELQACDRVQLVIIAPKAGLTAEQ
jgi:DNA-binding NarL/FixJ family response regulator